MKIIQLQVENIKKLKAVQITPDGAVVEITGPNGSGKSSVLDSIFWALAGTKDIQSKPVRKGCNKAHIRLDLGEVVVTRRFTDNGGTTLQVEAANGARFPSPQKMLDDLLGSLTFDPLAFSRMDPKKQLEQIRGLVKIDVDIDELDRLNKVDFDARTEINRDAKNLRAQAQAVVLDENAPKTPVDVSALLTKLQEAAGVNSDIERRKANREECGNSIAYNRKRAADIRDQIATLRTQEAAHEAEADKLQARLDEADPLPAPVDVAKLREAHDAGVATNRQVALREQRDALIAKARAAEEKADALTESMRLRTEQRQKAIAEAAMPVDGLSFGDGEVLFNDLPFDQASSAEQLRVSMAIAMAANPKLRVLRIKDGSLLDENGMRLIAEMAEAGDFQVWIEKVDTSGKVGIVMEDGSIREVQEEPVAA